MYLARRLFALSLITLTSLISAEPVWNWQTITEETADFNPTNLEALKNIPHWGAGSSCLQSAGLQTEGATPVENNWTEWLTNKGADTIGNACGSWEQRQADIACIKQAGLNTYRFSIEWSKIEPIRGHYNQEAMNWYVEFTNELIAAGIKPIPTLFHHAWPSWSNGFEDEQGIEDFTKFAEYAYAQIMTHASKPEIVDTWITLNEPIGYAMAAYVDGSYPPGRKKEFCTCGKVAYNFLRTHCAVYDALHDQATRNNHPLQIGIAQVFNPIQAYNSWNPADLAIAYYMNYLLNNAALDYFKTGNFKWLSSLPNGTKAFDADAPSKLDFIGVNYYSHTLIGNFKTKKRPGEILSDTDPRKPAKSLYAEGFYEALHKAATLGKPIWVTENGFGTDDVEKRTLFFKRHMYVLNKALQEGLDIRGYLFWTLVDGYEWNVGNTSNYGMFTKERTLKPNMKYFVDLLKTMKPAPSNQSTPTSLIADYIGNRLPKKNTVLNHAQDGIKNFTMPAPA